MHVHVRIKKCAVTAVTRSLRTRWFMLWALRQLIAKLSVRQDLYVLDFKFNSWFIGLECFSRPTTYSFLFQVSTLKKELSTRCQKKKNKESAPCFISWIDFQFPWQLGMPSPNSLAWKTRRGVTWLKDVRDFATGCGTSPEHLVLLPVQNCRSKISSNGKFENM